MEVVEVVLAMPSRPRPSTHPPRSSSLPAKHNSSNNISAVHRPVFKTTAAAAVVVLGMAINSTMDCLSTTAAAVVVRLTRKEGPPPQVVMWSPSRAPAPQSTQTEVGRVRAAAVKVVVAVANSKPQTAETAAKEEAIIRRALNSSTITVNSTAKTAAAVDVEKRRTATPATAKNRCVTVVIVVVVVVVDDRSWSCRRSMLASF